MMLRVGWNGEWSDGVYTYKKRGTVVGYVYANTDTLAVVLRDDRPGHGRGLETIRLSSCHPIGWRREYQIT